MLGFNALGEIPFGADFWATPPSVVVSAGLLQVSSPGIVSGRNLLVDQVTLSLTAGTFSSTSFPVVGTGGMFISSSDISMGVFASHYWSPENVVEGVWTPEESVV